MLLWDIGDENMRSEGKLLGLEVNLSQRDSKNALEILTGTVDIYSKGLA